MRPHILLGLLLLLTACAQAPFSIDDAAFGQERMAHSVGIGTMYLDSTTRNGAHNCDDSPGTCCASGYHMCTSSEMLAGGREIEDTGTGRNATTYAITGWADALVETTAADCTGWSTSGLASGMVCSYSTTGPTCGTGSCGLSQQTWCCSS